MPPTPAGDRIFGHGFVSNLPLDQSVFKFCSIPYGSDFRFSNFFLLLGAAFSISANEMSLFTLKIGP